MKVCSYFNGGDCVTIEQYVFAECDCKYTNYLPIMKEKEKKD